MAVSESQTTDEPWEHCGVLACAMRAQCVQPQDCKSGQQHQTTESTQAEVEAGRKAGNNNRPSQTTIRPLICDDCHWRMGWLHLPNQYWCAVVGSGVGNGKCLPDWCPTERSRVREGL